MTLDRVIRSWIVKAEGDFAVAEHELSLPPEKMVREAVCFHCQQMAEKYLKAFLASRGAGIEKTHSLSRILSECTNFDPDLTEVELGKLDGYALRVPVQDGSVVDLTAELAQEVTVEEVNQAVKSAAEGPLKGILVYCDEPIVSSDVIGNPASSVFDSLCTMVTPKPSGNIVKIVSWYDNEWGFSQRVVDLMGKIAKV